MRILDRYMVREFFIPFGYCVFAFMLIYIIYDLSAHLDDYIESQIPVNVMARYYLTQIPLVMVNIIPISILLSIVYSLGNLSRHYEVTAMRASGVSVYRIIVPYFLIGIFFTLFLFYLNENFAPEAYARAEKLIEEYEESKKEETAQPLAFYNPIAKRTWTAEWIKGSKVLRNVTVRNFANEVVAQKITADEARYIQEEYKAPEWWFMDGSIQDYDADGRRRGKSFSFNKRRFAYDEKPGDFLSSQKDSEALSYEELRKNMALYPRDSDIYRRKLVDLSYKIAFPFVGVTIILIAVPMAMRVTHGGAAGSVGLSIGLCISYYVLGTVSLAAGRGGLLSPFIASWLPNIVFSGVGLWLIYESR